MKLRFGAAVNTASSTLFANGTVTVAVTTRLPNSTAIAVSPAPITATAPSSSTVATVSSLLVYLAQWVTSSTAPSL